MIDALWRARVPLSRCGRSLVSCPRRPARAAGSPLIEFKAGRFGVLPKCDDCISSVPQHQLDHGRRLVSARSQITLGGEPNSAAISAKSASWETSTKPLLFA